jgi:hypothetical protein
MILKIRYFAALQTLYFAQSDWLYQCISLHFVRKLKTIFHTADLFFAFQNLHGRKS